MSKNLKTCRTKKLISSAVLCAIFSSATINSVFAETWNSTTPNVTADTVVTDSLILDSTANITNSANISVNGDSSATPAIPADMTIYAGGAFTNNTNATLSVGNNLTNKGTITNNGTITAATLQNTTSITGDGTLNINNGGSSAGAISQGTLNVKGGTFTNSSTINTTNLTNAGTIEGSGTLEISGVSSSTGAITQNILNVTGGELTTTKTLTVNTLTNAGKITGGGTLNINNGGSSSNEISTGLVNINGGTFTNFGKIETNKITMASGANLKNTADAKIYAEMENNGNIDNDGYGVFGNLQNKGTIYSTGSTGDLLITGGLNDSNASIKQNIITIHKELFTNKGSIETNTLNIGFTIPTSESGKLENNGEIKAGSLYVKATSPITGTGDLIINNGGSSTGTITQDNITFNGGTFTNNNTLTANKSLTVNTGATLTNTSTVTANNLTNTGTIDGEGTLDVRGVSSSTGAITQNIINVTSGTFENKGNLTANNELKVESGAVLGNIGDITVNTLNNSGTITGVGDGAGNFGYGDLIVKNGGSSSGDITQYSINFENDTFVNDKLIDVAKFTNSATISGDGKIYIIGDSVSGESSSTGTIAQKTFELYSGTFNNGGSLTISDQLIVGEDGVITNAILNNIDEITTNELYNYSTITGDTGVLTIKNGGSSTGTITQKDINFTGGTFENNNTLTANESLTVNTGAKLTNASTVIANNLTNKGTIDGAGTLNVSGVSSSTGAITQNIINVTSGTFENKSDLTAQSKLTIGEGAKLNNTSDIAVTNSSLLLTDAAVLENKGTINSAGGKTILADKIINTGTINLTSATLETKKQNGNIEGVINIKGNDISNQSIFNIEGPNNNIASELNVGGEIDGVQNTSTLILKAGEFQEGAKINLDKGSVITLQEDDAGDYFASLIMDNNDSWKGDINLGNGDLFVNGINIEVGKDSTVSGGQKAYFKQTGGALALNNSTFIMEDASKISGGGIVVFSGGKFVSKSNGFNIDELQTVGTIDAINNQFENYQMNTINVLNEDSSIVDNIADFTVDLYAKSNSNSQYDTYGDASTKITGVNGAIINIADWNIHGDLFGADAPIDKNIQLNIFKGTIESGKEINFTATDKEVLTPVGYYRLTGNGNGSYNFGLTRYNPTAFRGQVTKMAQFQNQLAINDMLFNHTMVEQGFKGNDLIGNYSPNRYASSSDLFAPYQYSRKDGGLWFKSYANFERLNMNHGLNVGNNAYGSIIGADFGLKELNNGWSFMPTAYVGYNGANQYWNGTGAYQNGVQTGFLGTWYKDNLILGSLTYVGMYGNSMETPRGTDDTMNYFAGVATKAAYNYQLTKDLALQPNLLFAYSYFGQENWHTDFGQMGMMSGMLHGINMAPGLNLIWEKDTFSAYATVQYMYNLNQSVGGRAGNIDIANVHMDRGYIQYGVGVNKKFTDRFSGYFQTVVRNVGRTGIAFMLGCNWKLGKEVSNTSIATSNVPELKKTNILLNNIK